MVSAVTAGYLTLSRVVMHPTLSLHSLHHHHSHPPSRHHLHHHHRHRHHRHHHHRHHLSHHSHPLPGGHLVTNPIPIFPFSVQSSPFSSFHNCVFMF